MIIGLTGGIGSGKSAVADLLAQEGARVIDTDLVSREVVVPPSQVLKALTDEFGSSVLRPNGELDRKALAAAVFGNRARVAKLNEITHPAIRARTLELVAAEPPDAAIVVVVPLLFQSGFDTLCDRTISVSAPADLRRQRLMTRDGMKEAEINARMRAQLPDDEYAKRADIVIQNTGNLAELKRNVADVWASLRTRTQGGP